MIADAAIPELRAHSDQAILWPARPDNPATIMAALGAGYLLHHAGYRDARIRWVPVSAGDHPDVRPEIMVPGASAMEALASAIAEAPAPDPSVYPAGTTQTLGSAVTAYLAEHPDLRHVGNASVVLQRELRDRGHHREAALIGGSVGVVPGRRGGWPPRLRRSPITRGAKSDIRAATEGWRAGRPLTADRVAHHLIQDDWQYTLRSGDWGLDANHWGEARQVPNPRFGNPVLARLITAGVMAMDGAWIAYAPNTYNLAAYPPALGWPIWDWEMPWTYLTMWLSWPLDPFGEVNHPPPTTSYGVGMGSRGVVAWYVAEAIPINRMISTYRHGTLVAPELVRQTMYAGVESTQVIPASTATYIPGRLGETT